MAELIAVDPAFSGITAVTILFQLASCVLVASNHTVASKDRNIFLASFLALAFITFADWLNYVYVGDLKALHVFHVWSIASTFAVAPVLPMLVVDTVFPPKRPCRPLIALLAAQAILELVTIFCGLVFTVDAMNVYHRGSCYGAYVLTYVASSVYLCARSVRAGTTYQAASLPAMLSIIIVMATGVGIQLADTHVRTTWPAVSLSVVLYFLLFLEMVLNTDALTHLLNRHSYESALEGISGPCTVVLVDVNRFKHVNDTFGHAYGDACLQVTARLLLKTFAPYGRIYRIGGDEFCCILTKRTADADALESRLDALLDEARSQDPRLPTLSVGHAHMDYTGSLAATVRAADAAMYEAKERAHARDDARASS